MLGTVGAVHWFAKSGIEMLSGFESLTIRKSFKRQGWRKYLSDMDARYYCHCSTGKLLYDPGKGTKNFDPWWVILECDKGIVDFYGWLASKNGVVISKNQLWGPHISVVKGEEPPKKENWGKDFGEVRLRHTNVVRTDNGMHAWVDAWSEDLAKIRQELGLTDTVKMSYHITLGRVTFDGRT